MPALGTSHNTEGPGAPVLVATPLAGVALSGVPAKRFRKALAAFRKKVARPTSIGRLGPSADRYRRLSVSRRMIDLLNGNDTEVDRAWSVIEGCDHNSPAGTCENDCAGPAIAGDWHE
jgi:hypothetical protein